MVLAANTNLFDQPHFNATIICAIVIGSSTSPNAFLNLGKHKIIFKHAKLKNNKLSLEVEIE